MKVGLYQGLPVGGDLSKAFACIESQLLAAAHAGAKMLVFPELFLPGYNQPKLHRRLAQTQDGQWMKHLSSLASKHKCGMVVGWPESDNGKIFNVASCFDSNGNLLAHHRKIQLFGDMEKSVFYAANEYTLFEFEGHKAALLICYDIEFAQHCRALADQGVSLLFVPTANPKGLEYVSKYLVPARACEMGLTIVYANYCGIEQDLSYAGLSLIVGGDGEAIVMAGSRETLLVADILPATEYKDRLSTQLIDYKNIKSVNNEYNR